MNRRIPFFLGATVVLSLGVQAQTLQGKILNKAGKAVANAIVTLTPQGLADTTGTDGIYRFSNSTSILPGLSASERGISFNNGILEILVGHPLPVSVEIFDTRGVRLKSEAYPLANAGVYRWNIAKSFQGTRMLLITAKVGDQSTTFRHTQLQNGGAIASVLDRVVVGRGLAREAAATDSLKVSAAGYVPKTVAVPNLDATLDVTLDTVSTTTTGRSAGCGKSPTLTSGARTISSGGSNRSFILRIPPSYDNNHPYPLVFAYHWLGGTKEDVDGGGTSGYTWSYYGLREKADLSTDHKMIFVAAQGNGNGWGNGGNSDVIFTDNMIKLIEDNLCVDTQRLFAMGFSYGGGMTKALGCQRPKVFRALAVYAGADFLSGGCDASSTAPIAYIGMHSVSDGTNSYSSGEAIRDRFVRNNGCTPATTARPVNNNHVCTTYQGCKPGYPTEWCAFDGGGHGPAPVDGQTNGYGGGEKTWTKAEVWKFFTQF